MTFPLNRSRRKALIALASLGAGGALSSLVFGKDRADYKLSPPNRPVNLGYFGMHVLRLAVRQPWYPYGDRLTAWPTVPFGVLRPAYSNWHNLQPTPGRWNFSALDHCVSMAEQHGAEVMLPLCSPPRWASARPDEKSPWGEAAPGGAAEPLRLSDWSNYVRTVAERYKGRIRQFEFWNEPNARGHTPFFTGSIDSAVMLTSEAYRVLKSVDHTNVLVGPAGVGWGREFDWIDEYLSKGASRYLDKLSHHFYVASSEPEAMIDYVSRFRALAQQHGLDKLPVVNSESGWVIANDKSESSHVGADESWPVLTQDLAAAYVARALLLGWALGLDGYHFFCWDHNSMGFIEPATKEVKPAGVAYGKTVEWLVGAVMTDCRSISGVWVCSIRKPSGDIARILWREKGEVKPWTVPEEWNAREYESLAGETKSAPSALPLGQQPVLLR